MADDGEPLEWSAYWDAEGNIYYYNSVTGESAWEAPEKFNPPPSREEPSEEEAAAQQQAEVGQPAGTWTVHNTDDGQEYFYNADTGETTWERPEGAVIVEPEAVETSPQRQQSPSASGAIPMHVDEEAKAAADDEQKQAVEGKKEEEAEIEEVDPAVKAEQALKRQDAIMERECYSNIQKVVEKYGVEEGAKLAQESLTEGYHGHTVICGLLGNWLADFKVSVSSSTSESGKIEDNTATAADEVRDIVQTVLNDATKESFNKTKGDEIMTRMSKAEAWYIDEMIESPRWRKLLIDLATTNKDSVLLKYCIRRISDHGHHRELAKRIKMTDDFSVYNSTLKAEFGAIGNLLDSASAETALSMDLSDVVEDIKRMSTSASFTYLYAVELLRTLVSKTKQEDDSDSSRRLQSAIRKWERLIEELENAMSSGQDVSSMFRKRRLDTALLTSELHQRQRRRHKPPSASNDNVDRDEDRDMLGSAVEDILKRYSRGLPLDDRVLNKLLPADGNEDTSDTVGKLMVAHPLCIQALLGYLFKPGSSRAGSMVTRNKCARLIAVSVLAADSAVGNKPPPESESEESPVEKLTGMLLTASQLCELLENMMTFEVISDPKLASDDSSAGRKLCALALLNAPIAQGVIMWASEIAKGPDFVTTASYPTFAPSILSLARVISEHHPFTRSAVLDIGLVFLKHTNRELSYQKMTDLKLQALRLLIILLVKGEVCAVLGSVTKRLRQQGTSEIDASLVRYFVGGLLDVMRPPFSLPLLRELGPMLTAPKCIDALRSSYFDESNKKRLSLLIKSFPDTLKKNADSCTKEDTAMVLTLQSIYCS